MAKKKSMQSVDQTSSLLSGLWGLIVWLTGILVSLAVGFGMISETLTIPKLGVIVTVTAGWFVVILTILGVLLKIIDSVNKE